MPEHFHLGTALDHKHNLDSQGFNISKDSILSFNSPDGVAVKGKPGKATYAI